MKQKQTSGLTLPGAQALQALQGLQKLAAADLPALEAFELSKLIASLAAAPGVIAFDKTRLAIYKKHGTQQENGNITVDPTKAEEFRREIAPLVEATVELAIKPLAGAILQHAMKTAPPMTAADMLALGPFFAGE